MQVFSLISRRYITVGYSILVEIRVPNIPLYIYILLDTCYTCTAFRWSDNTQVQRIVQSDTVSVPAKIFALNLMCVIQ